jgi:hypothetical protein
MPVGRLDFLFEFADSKIARVEQQMVPAAAPEPTALRLTDDIREAINGALDNQTPMLIAYCDDNEQIHLSFRGTSKTSVMTSWRYGPVTPTPGSLAISPLIPMSRSSTTTRRSRPDGPHLTQAASGGRAAGSGGRHRGCPFPEPEPGPSPSPSPSPSPARARARRGIAPDHCPPTRPWS